jgi:YbbR domain-containing protein
MKTLSKRTKTLPSLLTALFFAIAVWVYAVTASDPTETRTFPQSVQIDIIGLNPNLMIVNEIDEEVDLSIRAPASILNQLENERSLVSVTLDLSGLEAGVHTLTPQVNIGLSPAEVVKSEPSSIFIKLESVVTETFPIGTKTIGNPAIGFELQAAELSSATAQVTGPQSLMEAIDQVVVKVDVEGVSEIVQRSAQVIALDVEGHEIKSLSITPSTINLTLPVTKRADYDIVVVKIVTTGQIAAGYKLTYIYADPATVTIFSSDPNLLASIKGYLETTPINLNGANEDIEIRVNLNLPEGIDVVDSQMVIVQIGIDPIESSISLTNIPIQFIGLTTGLKAEVSPEFVDVYLSGPLDQLEGLNPATIMVMIDLTGRGPGTYQLVPEVILDTEDVNVDAILPSTIEVTITN